MTVPGGPKKQASPYSELKRDDEAQSPLEKGQKNLGHNKDQSLCEVKKM